MNDNGMRFGSAVTFEQDADTIATDMAKQVEVELGGSSADLALLFHTPHYAELMGSVIERLATALPDTLWIGCTGEGVIGRNQEIERDPAITGVFAHLPGVKISPFSLMIEELRSVFNEPASLSRYVDRNDDTQLVLLLADPFTVPMDSLLKAFNRTLDGVPAIGGMVSGTAGPEIGAMILGDTLYRKGAIGAVLSGNLQTDLIVSQGCRPVGPMFTVTKAEGNMIRSLEGERPVLLIEQIIDELGEKERDLLQNGLFVGRAIDSEKDVLGRGDFLIRGVMGFDPENGTIAVGDRIRTGEIIQFHLRDAQTAREDLTMLLTPHALFEDPKGAFLFSCNGRGTRLYDYPDGDVLVINQFFQDLPLAGFFCAGEIGPIGGRNFLHGHTASLALIRPAPTGTP